MNFYSSLHISVKIFLWTTIIIFLQAPTDYNAQNLLKQPQQIIIDAEHNRYLVSNYQSAGDIVQIDNLGNQSYFVEDAGMNDAMQIAGNIVYGSGDGFNGSVLGYDLETGNLVMDLHIAGTTHISGFEVDSLGILYASERYGTRIFKINPKTKEYWVFAEGHGINEPNGLLYEPEKNRMLVLLDQPGKATYAINLTDSTVYLATNATKQINGSDGITKDKYGNYYISGYFLPGLYRFDSTFSSSPQLIYTGRNIVYPTYDVENHALLITHYSDDEWSSQSLLNPIMPSLFTVTQYNNGAKLQWKNPSNRLDGTTFNNFKVLIYRNGNLIDSLSQTSADTNGVREFVDDIVGWFNYKIRIKTDETLQNFSQFTDEIMIFTGQVSAEYSNDFENGIGTMYNNGLWDTTKFIASNGLYSITDSPDSNYKMNQNTYILTPPISIEQGVSLQFDHIGIMRVPSMGSVEISTDNGDSYTSLKSVTAYLYEAWKDFSANEGDWQTETIDLSEFEGKTIIIRFRLYTGTRSDMDGWYIDNIKIGKITGVENLSDDISPYVYELKQNYPNPFNPNTVINYSIPQKEFVQLKVFDILGNEIITLVNEEKPMGNYKVQFNASSFASGIYLLRIQSGTFVDSKKLILLK